MAEKQHPLVIMTVPAYQTSDGERFHDLAEAQTHQRRALYSTTYDKLCQSDATKYAKIDRALFIDAMMAVGTHVGFIANEKLEPRTEEPKRSPEAARKIGKAPELAMPYGNTVSEAQARAEEPTLADYVVDQETADIATRFAPVDPPAFLRRPAAIKPPKGEVDVEALERELADQI